jgi:hypothetical protein
MSDVYIEVITPSPTVIELYPRDVFVSNVVSGGFPAPYTGFTGGTTNDLDGEATTTLDINTTIRFVIVDVAMTGWQLVSGTNAEDVDGGIVRPDDYAAITNEKVWKRVLGF